MKDLIARAVTWPGLTRTYSNENWGWRLLSDAMA